MTSEPTDPLSCDDFALLISCALDDELAYEQQVVLTEHLACCNSCRQLYARFEELNGFVGKLGDVTQASVVRKSAKNRQDRSWRSLLPYAAVAGSAAMVLLAIGISFSLSQKVAAEEILTPLVSLAEINSQRIRDQEFLKESLELDLRTLRLQLAPLERQASSDLILDHIDELMNRINKFETTKSEMKQE